MSNLLNMYSENTTPHFNTPTSGYAKHSLLQKNVMFRSPQGVKSFVQMGMKPKGLSMRTTSDLNIYGGNALPSNKTDKKDNFISIKSDVLGQPVSPARQKFLQKQSLRFEQKRGIFLKRKSPIKDPKKTINDAKQKIMQQKEKELMYPEPEHLAYYYDEEEEFYKNCTKNLDIEFKKLKMYIPETEDDDEGFISDPEFLLSPKLPFRHIDDSDNEEKISMELDLPDTSDIEDF